MAASILISDDARQDHAAKIRAIASRRLGYRPALDGIRGIAILVVMAHHAYLPFAKGGQTGVDIFFVLSGFLITILLLEEWNLKAAISLKRFYFRRALRLLPALLAFLVVVEGYSLFRLHGEYFWKVQKAVLAIVFYCSNWMRVFNLDSMGPLAHTWSLSVEEQFYLLWPPLLLFFLARIRKKQIVVFLAFAVMAVVLHRYLLWSREGSWERIYNGTDTHLDGLLIGCIAAFLFASGSLKNKHLQQSIKYLCLPAILFLAVVIVKPLPKPVMCTYGWTTIQIAILVLLLRPLMSDKGLLREALEFRPLVWVGRISYGLYLWHLPIFSHLGTLKVQTSVRIVVMFMAAIAVTTLSYYLVERPFLKFKSRLRTS
jgi:peptidoglycan/LPS O-acetylase OafA/YrhL